MRVSAKEWNNIGVFEEAEELKRPFLILEENVTITFRPTLAQSLPNDYDRAVL